MEKSLFCRLLKAMSAAVLVCQLVLAGGLCAQSSPPDSLQASRDFLSSAIRVHRRHWPELLSRHNVVGTAVGVTLKGEPAIKIFTQSDEIMNLPVSVEGLPVEIEAIGPFYALPVLKTTPSLKNMRKIDPAGLFPRPVPIGVSTGNTGDCSSGTIGARVKDANGNVYALSNNHVYALENRAGLNSGIVQPGLADVHCQAAAANVIGMLSSFVPIDFSSDASNTVDAAIAASDPSLLGNATPSKGGYGAPQSATLLAFVGQKVQKYGETTRLTKSKVSGIDATVLVNYDSGQARFINQIVVTSSKAFIGAGDSGSLLVTRSGANPVGLLFAGDGRGRTAIANPIDSVLSALGITIDGR